MGLSHFSHAAKWQQLLHCIYFVDVNVHKYLTLTMCLAKKRSGGPNIDIYCGNLKYLSLTSCRKLNSIQLAASVLLFLWKHRKFAVPRLRTYCVISVACGVSWKLCILIVFGGVCPSCLKTKLLIRFALPLSEQVENMQFFEDNFGSVLPRSWFLQKVTLETWNLVVNTIK